MTAQDFEMPKDVVPPGDQTGVYYIPISNLPFNVSWQQIKDYVRQVCDVDHVEIFQKSTSGWVRVRGRENFDAAYGHLNGKEFNGRAIIADGRNGESPILVRDLDVCKPTGSTNKRPSSGGKSLAAVEGSVTYSDSLVFSSPTSTTSSSFSQVRPSSHTSMSSYSSSSPRRGLPSGEYQCLVSMPAARELMMSRKFAQQQDGYRMSMACSNFMGSPDMSFSQGLVNGGYDPHMTTTTAAAAAGGFPHPVPYAFGSVQATQPQAFMAAYPTSSDSGAQAMCNAPTSYAVQPTAAAYNDYYLGSHFSNLTLGTDGIYTEQRGVHIRDISRRASEDQIRRMIREVTGPEAAALIEAIKVPVQEGGAPRGHAFVHFRSASLARRLVDHLNGQEFKGRKLQVRLMKEGDAIGGGGGGSGIGGIAFSNTNFSTTSMPAASSSKQRSGGKHHQHHSHSHSRHGGGEDHRRAERKEREKSGASSSSKKAVPLVVSGGSTSTTSTSTTTPVTASASSKEKHSKKSLSVVIADGSFSGHAR